MTMLSFKNRLLFLGFIFMFSCYQSKKCYKKIYGEDYIYFNTKDSVFINIVRQGMLNVNLKGKVIFKDDTFYVINDLSNEDCFQLKKERINLNFDTIMFQASPNTKNFGCVSIQKDESWELISCLSKTNGKLLFAKKIGLNEKVLYNFKFLTYNFELDSHNNSYYLNISDKCLNKSSNVITSLKTETYIQLKNTTPQLIVNTIDKDTFYKVSCNKCETK